MPKSRERESKGIAAYLPMLREKKWRAFPVASIFESIDEGKGKGRNHLSETIEGGISYIGATNRHNGVLCFVEVNEDSESLVQRGNCIGFIKNGDGAAGYAVYKAESFISSSDVLYGYAPWINKYTGLFFVAAQDLIKSKYSHGYKRNMKHLNSDQVMLPVTEKDKPDLGYMEAYAQNLMFFLCKRQLAYLRKC